MIIDFKNKISFFLISFLLSFGVFFILRNYFTNTITTDLIAYALAVFLIGATPITLYLIWQKINKWQLFCLYLFSFLITVLAIPTINFLPFRQFITENIFSIIFVVVLSLIGAVFLKIIYKKYKIVKFRENKILKYFFYSLIFFIIAFLIYNPKYKYSFEKISLFGYESYHQFHHVTFYLIPVYEMLHGKTLLFNVSSLYGIGITYINSFIFKFFNLTYSNFILYDMIISIIYTGILFVILKKITKSFWLSLLGTLAFIRLAFYRDFPANTEIFIFPSTTPIRSFFDVIIFYQIFEYFSKRVDYKKFLIMSGTVVLAFFYGFDFGLLILLAYIATLGYDIFLSFFNRERLLKIFTKTNQFFLTLLTFIFAGVLIITGITFFQSGALPNFSQYFFHISTQTVQLNDQSLPSVIGWHYLPLSIYLIGFYYLFYQTLIKKKLGYHWLVFLIVYGLLSFTYYINLSEPNHLFSIMQPAVIIIILLIFETKNNLIASKKSPSFLFNFLTLIFFLGIFLTIFFVPQSFISQVIDKVSYRYSPVENHYYYWNYSGTGFYLQDDDGKNFKVAADAIKKYTKNDRQTVIISRYSALLYMMSGKTSLIDHPNIENDIYSVQEFDLALNKIKILKPKYVFVHSPDYSQWYADIMNQLWNKIKDDYIFIERAGAVDIYKIKS